MKITFPHMGRIHIPLTALFKEIGIQVITPPPNNDDTKRLGYKYSPEYACMPFKMILGNIINSLDSGADTVVMLGGSGPCRFGYFGHLVNLILKDRGYRFEFINLEPSTMFWDIHHFKAITGCRYRDLTTALILGWHKLQAIDSLEALYWAVLPRSLEFDRVNNLFARSITELSNCDTVPAVFEAYRTYRRLLTCCITCDSALPKVGIVGDIYTLNEPYSNHNVETMLAQRGVITSRAVYTSEWVKYNALFWERRKRVRQMMELSKGYLSECIGGFALETVYHSLRFADNGYDGILHVMPVTCIPEIVSKQILSQIARKKNIPVMSITVDEHNDKTGIETRLEAFAEILHLKNGSTGSICK